MLASRTACLTASASSDAGDPEHVRGRELHDWHLGHPRANEADTIAATVRTLAASPADEVQPVVSPDGKWLAYTSNETDGRYEVYIASIADPMTRIQVSTEGANAPVWRADSKTLVYGTSSHFVSATFAYTPRIEVVRRDTLFVNTHRAGAQDRVFDYNRKTGEFLVLSAGAGDRARIVVVTGWFEELKERMARGGKR